MRKSLFLLAVLLFAATVASFSVKKASAAGLTSISDTISTSRPSPSTPISTDASSGVGFLSVVNNKSRFLASDSAVLINGATGSVLQTAVVASQSADYQTVFLTKNTTSAVNHTTVLAAPITAVHTIKFTTINGVPSSGKIVITFPGSANTTASPSADSFAFNALGNTQVKFNNASCTINVGSPSVTCTTTAAIAPNTTVTALIGCTAGTTTCTAPVPKLINPTKSAALGTADLWTIEVATKDSSNNVIDSGKARIGTVDAVQVQATVDPSLTFTISGIPDNTNLLSDATWGVTGCSDTTSAGFDPTATDINLGFLTASAINIAAQQLSVTTNAANGYAISATSSGTFINPATGYWIQGLNGNTSLTANDTPAPAAFGSSNHEGFGISACGPRASAVWGSGTTAFGSGSKYSNPYNTGANSFYATIASYAGGTGVADDKTNVRYAASISGTTPAGVYSNYFTYIATATF